MIKIIGNITKKFMDKPAVIPLGRWNIDSCIHKINHKVDMSNEDHCGICDQYGKFIISKIDSSSLDKKGKGVSPPDSTRQS